MATDLHTRATTARDDLAAVAAKIDDALAVTRTELSLRHPDPSSVARANWAVEFGAAQHVDVASVALVDEQELEADIRRALSAIVNPADAQTFEVDLRDNLIEQAELQVELRLARERKERAEALLDGFTALQQRATENLRAAEGHVAWAKDHQDAADGLLAALAAAPLSTMVADAGAVLLDAPFTDADARLTALLPADLRTRATERFEEAHTLVDESVGHGQTGQAALDEVLTDQQVLDGPFRAAQRIYLAAETALSSYVSGAAVRLGATTNALTAIADHEDLTPAQVDALSAANNVAGDAAVADEGVLAAALVGVQAAQRDVDDAILAAVSADPDTDPLTDAAVIAAIDARDAPALQDPLNAARAAYDVAARTALNEWEVEVPPSLWDALGSFLSVQRSLDELANAATATTLTADLGSAQDDLAAALDDRDEGIRRRTEVGLLVVERTGAVAAARRTILDRQSQYLRGDGPSGRVPSEL